MGESKIQKDIIEMTPEKQEDQAEELHKEGKLPLVRA